MFCNFDAKNLYVTSVGRFDSWRIDFDNKLTSTSKFCYFRGWYNHCEGDTEDDIWEEISKIRDLTVVL